MLHVGNVTKPERDKYEAVWARPEYHEFSPGLENVDRFMEVVKPLPGSTVVDIGCGSGVAGLELERRGLKASWLDLTDVALDPKVNRNRFTKAPIWKPMGVRDYGFCCDVLEHVPPEFTMLAIWQITNACATSWFQVSFQPDRFGPELIGQPLHLTVMPFVWWRDRFAMFGVLREARDLCGMGVFVVQS